jgi:hypothetical protein
MLCGIRRGFRDKIGPSSPCVDHQSDLNLSARGPSQCEMDSRIAVKQSREAMSAISAPIPIRGGTNASWHQHVLPAQLEPLGVVREEVIYCSLSRLRIFAVPTVLRMQDACNLRSPSVEPSPAVTEYPLDPEPHDLAPEIAPAKAQLLQDQPSQLGSTPPGACDSGRTYPCHVHHGHQHRPHPAGCSQKAGPTGQKCGGKACSKCRSVAAGRRH